MFSLKNIIIQKESMHGVRQWHFNRNQTITIISTIIVMVGVSLFLTADRLSTYLYEKRLNEFKANYVNVSNNLELLKEKLVDLYNHIDKIEE